MSVGGVSNCTPCSPITPKSTVQGGGPNVDQSPIQAPVGSGNSDCFVPEEYDPCCCDSNMVPPPPVAVGTPGSFDTPGTAGTPIDGPPAPMPVPGAGGVDPSTGTPVDSGTAPKATSPANTLPEWSTWKREFEALGVDADHIAKLGAQPLTNEQLALVYVTIKRGLEAAGASTPSSKPDATTPGAGGWSPEWEQRFTKLGLSAEQVAHLRDITTAQGADDATLQQLYDVIAQQMNAGQAGKPGQTGIPGQTGTPGQTDTPGQTGSGTVPVKPGDTTTQTPPVTPPQGTPGWNADWEAKFRALGMPDSIVGMYASSGAPTSGLQAAYDFAKQRFDTFNANGWFDKLTKEHVPADQIWQMILSPKMPTESEIHAAYDAVHQQNMPNLQRKLQLGISLLPGGELVQYALGHKLVSGKQIDRSSPMNIAMAAASGLAAFAAFRGLKNIGAGWKAINALKGGTSEITKVGITMEQLGLHGQAAALNEAAEGAAQILTSKSSKFMSLVPFTKAHQQVVGLGHLESAARAFNAGGAEAILAASPSGTLAVQTLGRTFEDLMRGNMQLIGNRNAYLGNISMPFKRLKAAPMVLQADGTTIIANRALRAGKGGQTLTALLEAGGMKLANAEWLGNQAIADGLAAVPGSAEQLKGIGTLLAADAAPVVGANVSTGVGAVMGRVKPGVSQYFDTLVRKTSHPAWFTSLIGGAASDAVHSAGAVAEDVVAAGAADAAAGAAAAAGASIDDIARAVVGPAAGNTETLVGLHIGNLSTNDETRRFVLSGDADVVGAARGRIDQFIAQGGDVQIHVAHDRRGAERLIVQGEQDAVNALKRALRSARDHANTLTPA